MEKVKSLAVENKNNLLFLFLGGAILAGINTFFGRADYNLFIYICHIFGDSCKELLKIKPRKNRILLIF